MASRIIAITIAIATISGCGNDSSTGFMQSVDPDDFDRTIEECLIDVGITDNPLENVSIKYDNDPEYHDAFETCVKRIAPNDAEVFLSVHMEALRSLPDQDNAVLLDAVSCVLDKYDATFEGEISFREDRYIDFDAILHSFSTDIEALEYWKLLEECGGPPAPDIDPANFGLQRECLVHEHDGEPVHSHGNC